MANKAIDRTFLKKALESYNERLDDAVVGALPEDIVGEGDDKGIQTLEVRDCTTPEELEKPYEERTKLLTIVPAINELDRRFGKEDVKVVDNSDPSIAAEDRELIPYIIPAVNELDRKQGDADLTVIDTVAQETVAKDNISDAINVLDKEMGDCDTITIIDTTADPAKIDPEKEVVSSLNVLDKEVGNMATSTVVDTLAADYDPADPKVKMVVVEALNVLDAEMGELIDNKVTDTVNGKTEPEKTVVDSLNVLDTDLGDVNTLTVTDTTLDKTDPEKETVAAINVLDREVGDCKTITIIDTTADPAKTDPEIEVVASLNVLDKEMGDCATVTVVDVIGGETDPKKVAVEAINTLDKEMGDAVLTVIDSTDGKTVAETEARTAINVLDKEVGDANTITVVDTTADPAKTDPEKEVVASLNVLDREIGDCATIAVTDTVNAKDKAEIEVVAALNVLDADLGDVNTLTVKLEDGTLTKEAVAAINRLDEVQGDDVLTVIDTIEGKTEAEKVITTAINVLDKELGENKDLIPEINKVDTIVNAINSAFRQSVLLIEDVPIDPTDPDYSKVEHRYVFKQNFPAGTGPELPTNILQTIDIEKPKFVKEVTTFRYEGDPVIVDPQTQEELVLHHLYMKLVIENQEDPIYLDIDNLITDFIVEDTSRIDLTLETREEAGERIRVVSADIVPNSLKYSEFVDDVNKELRFTGFDHQIDTSMGEHYEICTDSTYGALLVVTGAPQGNQVALAEVQKINDLAGWGEHIEVGMHVLHKEAIPPATPQLTTTAQNLREAVNELDAKQGDEELTVKDEDGELLTTLSAAVNELDRKQGDDTITVIDTKHGKTANETDLSAAVNVLDDELGEHEALEVKNNDGGIAATIVEALNVLDAKQGDDTLTVVDTLAGETTPKTDLSSAVNVLDKEMGDINTLTVKNAAGDVLKEVAQAINQLDLVQGDDTILVVDAAGVRVATLTEAVNALEDRFPVKIEEVAEEDLNPGIKAAYKVTEGTSVPVDLGLIEIPYSNYDGDPNPVTVKVTVTNDDDNRIIGAEVVEGSLGRVHLDEAVNAELDFLDKPTELTTTEKASITKAINEVNLMKDVTVEEQTTPGPGVAKAFDIKQKDATGTDVVKGTIEIPFSNYEGLESTTVKVIVDNTDGSRTISADVQDNSIDHLQLTEEINQTLELVPEKITYKDSVSYIDFTGTYKDFADKNDLYIITTDFTVGGKTYNAGSWAICTEVFASGDRTWRYINNGGKSTIVRAITNPGDIREEYQEGKEVITDIINHQDDPMDTLYMIAVEQAGGLHAPHHGIYLKTGDIGQTAVAEIFDFGVGGGGGTYIGSHGTNIDVTITMAGEVGTVAASINAGTLTKGLMDTEINNIFNFTGYPTTLTTEATTLAGGVNELDARVGKLIDLDLGQTTNFTSIVEAINFLGFDGMMWKGTIQTTASTTSFASIYPIKRGWVYNITGADCTVNNLSLTAGDWIICSAPPAAPGGEPTFLKLGSGGSGFDDAGPVIIFR